ncbi:hypothetical protein ACWGUP_01825 [Streptomyces diastaticus]|uniref:hypothetical protein n=1 Tax=Streptomyces diastaticus TaxID=1956 RepID=UPI003D175801
MRTALRTRPLATAAGGRGAAPGRRPLGRAVAGAVLAAATLFTTAPRALADTSPSPSASQDEEAEAGPTEAGTAFRTAARLAQGQRGTASASTGDYLYWVFPADTGQRPTIQATVSLPAEQARQGASTWRIDVYDGLRRRQPCTYGHQERRAAEDASEVRLTCTLRTVRAFAEPWAHDPLPGAYYIRLTVSRLAADDLGRPFRAEVGVESQETGGSTAVGGKLSGPLLPGISALPAASDEETADEDGEAQAPRPAALAAPEDGWSSGWWTDRWLWTAGGAVLAALAGIFGYTLTRGSGRPHRVPPGV